MATSPNKNANPLVVEIPGGPERGARLLPVDSLYADQYRRLRPQYEQSMRDAPGALSALRDAQLKSNKELRGVYDDAASYYSKEDPSFQLGALGVGLMAPTQTGSFGESLGKGFAGALEQAKSERKDKLDKHEKLIATREAMAKLTSADAQAQADYNTNMMEMPGRAMSGAQQLSDFYTLGNGTTPTSDQGLVTDYMQNPAKYAGPRGQEMVKAAYKRLEKQAGTGGNKLTSVDKKAYLDAKAQNVGLQNALNNLDRAAEIGDKTLSGWFTGARASVGAMMGDQESKNHIEYQNIMEGEAIKQMSETLKGATTDKEMLRFINQVADPSVPWDVKKAAIERVKSFAQMLIDSNNDTMRGVATGTLYSDPTAGSQGNAPAAVPDDPAELQDGGAYELPNGSVGRWNSETQSFEIE